MVGMREAFIEVNEVMETSALKGKFLSYSLFYHLFCLK